MVAFHLLPCESTMENCVDNFVTDLICTCDTMECKYGERERDKVSDWLAINDTTLCLSLTLCSRNGWSGEELKNVRFLSIFDYPALPSVSYLQHDC